MSKKPLMVAMVALLAMVAMAPAGAQETTDTATVTVFHAVDEDDGFPADVYLDGELIIDGFLFESASDPFTVPAGTLDLEIYAHGADVDTADPVASDQLTFEADADYSIVAQWIGDGPVLSFFRNDTSRVEAGEARLTIRQASTAETVDVEIDGENRFTGVAQASSATADLGAGPHTVVFRGSGAVAERSIELAEGAHTILYVVGALDDDQSFGVLEQRVAVLQTAPSGVPTGSGGDKAAASPGVELIFWFLMLAGIAPLARRTLNRTG